MARKRIKKKVINTITFIIIILIIGIILFILNDKYKPFESKIDKQLKTVFSEEEVKVIKDNKNEDIVLELMGLNSFEKGNLDRYIEFKNSNKDLDNEKVVLLVNKDIDKIEGFIYDDIIFNLLDEKYYIYNNTNRYISYYKTNTKLTSKEVVTNVNSNIDRPFYTDMTKADLSKGNLILVNKYNYLDSDYEPDLVEIDDDYTRYEGYVTSDTLKAFKKMVDAASNDDITLYAVSPYRSYSLQNYLYERYASYDGYEKADTYSARPGSSEHQTGLAIDINAADDWFNDTKEAAWLAKNAYKYGFILRYPLGKEYITGYQYESWHYRYVGEDVAKYIYDNDLTYEEYYAFYVAK